MREVEALLREGYGAEDIGVRLSIAPELVRRHIARLRKSGRIKTVCRAWSQDRAGQQMKRPDIGRHTEAGPDHET